MTQLSLPEGFTPGDRDVVIGKGKKFYFHAGNQWLREVVEDRTEEYSQAGNKTEKSMILSSVVEYIRTHGRFVRLDKEGNWVNAEELLCREKTSAVFREKLRQSASPKANKTPVDVSQELIKRLVAANISSSTSKDNLRKYAMSMSTGNLNMLKPSRSGQFAAAKKQSFSKLSSSALGVKQRSFRGLKNATWGEPKPNKTTSGSNAFLQNLLSLEPTPLPSTSSLLANQQMPQMMGLNNQLVQPQPLFPQQQPSSSLVGKKGEDFRLAALKQMDAQLSDLVDARAQQQQQNHGNKEIIPDLEQEEEEDLSDLLNMPIMDLNPEDVDQFGMDAPNMSAFPDQPQSQNFTAV